MKRYFPALGPLQCESNAGQFDRRVVLVSIPCVFEAVEHAFQRLAEANECRLVAIHINVYEPHCSLSLSPGQGKVFD
jgi:hypothetical protein